MLTFNDYIKRYSGLTFDLHYTEKYKAKSLQIWIKRIYSVASILHFNYECLWDISEQEFIVLEELAREVIEKQKEAKQRLLEKK